MLIEAKDAPTTGGCSNVTDLMNDATIISDNHIIINYLEDRIDTSAIFNNAMERQIPSVAVEIFTIEFPESPEFWIEHLSILVMKSVKVDVILMTSQLCTNQTDASTSQVSQNLSMTSNLYPSTYYQGFDLSAATDGSMACVSKMTIKTRLSNVVADDSSFSVENQIKGCTRFAGEILLI